MYIKRKYVIIYVDIDIGILINEILLIGENTIKFFEIAAQRKGFEHKVIYTLCEMTFIENKYKKW